MNIKTQVLDHLLNLQQKTAPRLQQTNMKLALLGSEKSGKNEFFQYIIQYQSFDTQKSKQKQCVFEMPNCKMELFVMNENFTNQLKDLRAVSCIMFFKTSDQDSIDYVIKHLPTAKLILNNQILMYNKHSKSMETGNDVCQYLHVAEAEPLILVLAIKDKDQQDITQARKKIFDQNQRLQEIKCFNENCVNVLQVLGRSLIETYSDLYFQELNNNSDPSGGGCSGQ